MYGIFLESFPRPQGQAIMSLYDFPKAAEPQIVSECHNVVRQRKHVEKQTQPKGGASQTLMIQRDSYTAGNFHELKLKWNF